MNMLRTLALAVLTALALALPLTLTASPAQAHSGLTGAVPSDGTTVDSLPDEVTLEFSEEVRAPAFVVLTGPDGSTHEAGDPEISGARLTQTFDADSLATLDPNGAWTVAYRVVSGDGHVVQGQSSFTVEGADVPDTATPEPTPAETPSTSNTDPVVDDEGRGGAPYLIAAVLALLLVTVAATSRKKDQNQ